MADMASLNLRGAGNANHNNGGNTGANDGVAKSTTTPSPLDIYYLVGRQSRLDYPSQLRISCAPEPKRSQRHRQPEPDEHGPMVPTCDILCIPVLNQASSNASFWGWAAINDFEGQIHVEKQQKVVDNRVAYADTVTADATFEEIVETFKMAGLIEMGVDGKPRIKLCTDEDGKSNGDVL
ncbi:hypothetical protein PMIN01_03840 [Paraphaeosphaeria minitans]|uniref:Uncharacterized protein n=1 Tax=Paraphaeosphaeria minitans TaxID=565426 RepID=A0A9P6GMS2_9PLEO|nr:hypothetical protein PMIN01_03840 [Paraphaeosphaeria minitans]